MTSLNRHLFDSIHNLFLNSPLGIERAVIFGALYIPFIVAVVCLVAVFIDHSKRRRHWFVAEIAVSVLVAVFVLSENLQLLLGHLRPYEVLHFMPAIAPVAAFSFPSSHASVLFALAITVWFHHKRLGLVLAFLAMVNGLARIAVGVHWPADILGGIGVGIIAALVAHAFVRFSEETTRHA